MRHLMWIDLSAASSCRLIFANGMEWVLRISETPLSQRDIRAQAQLRTCKLLCSSNRRRACKVTYYIAHG